MKKLKIKSRPIKQIKAEIMELIVILNELLKIISEIKDGQHRDNKKKRPQLAHRGNKMSRNKQILILYKKGMSGAQLAARFKVTPGRIYHILKKMRNN